MNTINSFNKIDDETYEINTTQGVFKVKVEKGQFCCERSGVDYENYTDIIENIQYDRYEITSKNERSDIDGKSHEIFMDANTLELIFYNEDYEVITFLAFCEHNGYYSHDAWIYLNDELVREEQL